MALLLTRDDVASKLHRDQWFPVFAAADTEITKQRDEGE